MVCTVQDSGEIVVEVSNSAALEVVGVSNSVLPTTTQTTTTAQIEENPVVIIDSSSDHVIDSDDSDINNPTGNNADTDGIIVNTGIELVEDNRANFMVRKKQTLP